MLGLLNQYLTKIGCPEEFGYFGSLYLYYEFPNGVKMLLLDTYGPLSLYTFEYELFTKDNEPIILRRDDAIYQTVPFDVGDPEEMDAFFNRVMRLGIDEEIEVYPQGTMRDYKLENKQKMLNFMPWND